VSIETEMPLKQADPYSINKSRRKLQSPVAYLIERELFVVQFQGLIVIHTIVGLAAPLFDWAANRAAHCPRSLSIAFGAS
jgi:hypothetical protein